MYRQISLILMITFLGCESILEVELEGTVSEIVVTSVFTEDTPWQVLIQRTVGIQEGPSQSSIIDSAIVTIEGSNGSFVSLAHKGGGFYYADTELPQSGVIYTLRVEADGYKDVEATDQIPSPPKVQDIRQINAQGRIEVTLDDESGVTNYYAISVLSPGLQRRQFNVLNAELDDQMKVFAIQDPFVPYVDRPDVSVALIHDSPFDGKQFNLELSLGSQYSGDLSVHVRSISEVYFDYFFSKSVQENAEDLAFAEPAPLKSNIRGGQGLFAGYSLYVHGILSPEKIKDRIIGTYYQSSYRQFPEDPDMKSHSIEFTLHPDYSASGFMEFPSPTGSDEVSVVSLNGGYTLRYTNTIRGAVDYFIQLHHDEETFFRNAVLRLEVQGSARPIAEQAIHLTSYQEAWDRSGNYASIHRSFNRRDN